MRPISIFDNDWIKEAKNQDSRSWTSEVVEDLEGAGAAYLNTLRMCFERFPARSNKQKKHLKNCLESFNNEDHLGGVNELTCWELLTSFGWSVIPLPTTKEKQPDFEITSPARMFIEASTLNVSEADKKAIQQGRSVPLNHRHTIERALRKTICDKADQLYVGFSAKTPSILVLFDYTTFSYCATDLYHELAQYLFGEHLGFLKLPTELSALIYLERKVLDERICISKIRSAVYHNPNAAYKITDSVFGMFTQFAMGKIEIPLEDECAEHEAWLCPSQ